MIMEVSLIFIAQYIFYLSITFFLTSFFVFSNLDIFFEIPDDENILEDPGASNPVVSVSFWSSRMSCLCT